MTRHRLPWTEGRWTTPPVATRDSDNDLLVEAAKGSDFWEKTLYGFERCSGHARLVPWDAGNAVEVSFALRGFDELYDQAGLMLWSSPTHWIKAGVEVNDGVPHLGAVVTDTYSDWSLAPVPEWVGKIVTIRASRAKDAVIVRATAEGEAWRTVRVARFVPAGTAEAGPFVCAPERAGFQVRFVRWCVAEADAELHWSPSPPHP